MAGRTLAGGLGLTGDWALGENNWKDANDLDLLKLSVMVGKVVQSVVDADPGAPAEGDCYICSAAHPTEPNKVSCFDNGAWVYLDAPEGYKLWCIADAAEYQYTAGGGWAVVSAGATGIPAGGATGDVLTKASAADYDAAWAAPASGGGGGGSAEALVNTSGYYVPPDSMIISNTATSSRPAEGSD